MSVFYKIKNLSILNITKILIIRFSSIGDIVLTSPIIRSLKKQLNVVNIHYVTKSTFKQILENNPYLDKLYLFDNNISEINKLLKAENYDLVIDLHNNLRSLRLKFFLNTKNFSFNKLNVRKFFAVNFKTINVLPKKHIVDRYYDAVKKIGVKNDHQGLDYFIHEKDVINCKDLFFNNIESKFIVLVIGGSYFTKKIPLKKLNEICSNSKLPIVILGGYDEIIIANILLNNHKNIINTCGQYSLNQSASIINQAEWVITSDTGLMHIAAAFNKKIISVWGNTIINFGMSPYLPNINNKLLEISNLKCRPCSKLGFKKCPKGHFKCMNDIDFSFVSDLK